MDRNRLRGSLLPNRGSWRSLVEALEPRAPTFFLLEEVTSLRAAKTSEAKMVNKLKIPSMNGSKRLRFKSIQWRRRYMNEHTKTTSQHWRWDSDDSTKKLGRRLRPPNKWLKGLRSWPPDWQTMLWLAKKTLGNNYNNKNSASQKYWTALLKATKRRVRRTKTWNRLQGSANQPKELQTTWGRASWRNNMTPNSRLWKIEWLAVLLTACNLWGKSSKNTPSSTSS